MICSTEYLHPKYNWCLYSPTPTHRPCEKAIVTWGGSATHQEKHPDWAGTAKNRGSMCLTQLCPGRKEARPGSAMGTEHKHGFLMPQATAACWLFFLTSLKSWSNNILPRCWVSCSFVHQPLDWMCKCLMCSPTDVPSVASIVNICHLYLLSQCFLPKA